MIQRISKRFLSLLLVAVMVMAMVPAITLTAFAANEGTVTGLSDTNIGLRFTGTADNAWSATGTQIIGSATSAGGACGNDDYSSTLTITNNKATTATLSFDYAIEQNSGTITVDGTTVTADGKFSKELAPDASIKVDIKSGSTSAATEITMTNVQLVADVNATVIFQPAENGTYTVDGKTINEAYTNTQSSMNAYQVAATPAAGYQFLGWYNVTAGKYINTNATASLNIENDCTITAKFALQTAAIFETGGQRFDELGDAVSYAQANSQPKIALAADGSISGDYTIPAGITLLIPFDEAGTLYTDAPAAIRTAPASKPFRTLTMSDGASITVNGAISLGGRYFAAGGSQQGRPVGDYGYIKMADNSSITVKNGGNLYAWGFISGSGSVLAESGATVYEFYQIADFRGGSASSSMGNKVFPFSQYFVQNIEVPLTLNEGAKEIVYSGVYAMSSTYTTAIQFIGDNDGMFKIVSGSFTKDYDEATDRLVLTVNGEAELNTLSLTLAGMSVNSAEYVLPITNNISINIQSGKVTINQDTALLAGVEVSIAEGADLTIANGKTVYVYDSDEWNSNNFVCGNVQFKSVAYAPGKTYTRTNADLHDVKIDVNGSITAIGYMYTTAGGADICSSNGTGKFIQSGKLGTETVTYQYTQNGSAVTAHAIPITPAKLHNADGSYTETGTIVAGTTIPYTNGKWGIPDGWRKDGDSYYFYQDNTPVTGTVRVPYPSADLLPGYGPDAEDAEVNVPGKEGNPDNYDYPDRESALFVFDENGVFQKDQCGVYDDNDVTRWINNGMVVWHAGLIKDGDDYRYFKRNGMVANIETYVAKTNDLLNAAKYTFDSEGKLMQLQGLHEDLNGNLCYYVDYVKNYAGLVEVEGNYYYIASDLKAVKNGTYYVTKTNDLKPAGFYTFDADGKMVIKNGLINENGDLYFYVDGAKTAAGLIEVDGNYYYIASNLKAVKNAKHYVFADRANGLKSAGWYWFNEDGTMFLDGIREENGTKYYYKDGVKNYAGLIEIDGEYYYVKSDCSIVCGCSYYVTKNNGLAPSATYTFGADGRMEIKNGIYREKLGDGNEYLFYYVNNVRQINTGLVKLEDGSYIYVRSGANLAVGSYYVSKTNDLLPKAIYTFGEDGKMIVDQ